MMKPIVAIVGRPNVGKSTLINRISGRRVAIVDDMPGVTRDRIYADCEWCGKEFTLIDTGGIDESDDDISRSVKRQAMDAVEIASVVVFVTDIKQGMLAGDGDIAEVLRKSKKPVVLAVNKADAANRDNVYDFYALGLGEPILISAEHGSGVGDLLDEVCKEFALAEDDGENAPLKVAVVGKPNVGKSSLVNRLLGYERTIVSNIAGTTRDAIDTPITVGGKDYILIDTAGMRRKRDIEDKSIERYSVMRAIAAVKRADVVLIVVDASQPIAEQDEKIAGLVHESGKPSVVVLNKWDAVEKSTNTLKEKTDELKERLAFMSYFTSVSVSALTGQRVEKILQTAEYVWQNASRRISTGLLNELIGQAVAMTEPTARKGRKAKILYVSQPSVCPPLFVFKVNDAKLIHFSYERYLENSLRRAFDFTGTPITLKFIGREEK
ncbi:MAG: ribosome biogenesis GTPase Der [Clostridiales bacterium]|nr:ribosome biogenesis GTPase Der [Clostridiales bacterium]